MVLRTSDAIVKIFNQNQPINTELSRQLAWFMNSDDEMKPQDIKNYY